MNQLQDWIVPALMKLFRAFALQHKTSVYRLQSSDKVIDRRLLSLHQFINHRRAPSFYLTMSCSYRKGTQYIMVLHGIVTRISPPWAIPQRQWCLLRNSCSKSQTSTSLMETTVIASKVLFADGERAASRNYSITTSQSVSGATQSPVQVRCLYIEGAWSCSQ